MPDHEIETWHQHTLLHDVRNKCIGDLEKGMQLYLSVATYIFWTFKFEPDLSSGMIAHFCRLGAH